MEIIELHFLAMLIILALASLLPSCSLNMNNQAKSIHIPAFLQDKDHQDALNQLPYQAWWKGFNAPELDRLIDKALIHNNDITIAKQSIRVADAELKTIRLNWLPGVEALAGFSQNPALGTPGAFYGILPSYYLNFFKLYFQQKTAEYKLQRSKAYYLGVRLTMIGQVVSSYFSLLAWHHQLMLLNQIERDNRRLLESIGVAKTQGLANNLQWLTIKRQLQEVKGLQKQVQTNIVASENAVHYLINEPPGRVKLDQSFQHLVSEAVPLNKINVQVILHRPDVMVAWASLQAACSGINVSESQWLPSLSLDYFAGKASFNGTLNNPTSSASYSDAYATFNLSPTLFGQVATSKAIFKKSLAEYNNVIQNALRLIGNGIVANQKFMEKLTADRYAYDALRRRYQLQQALYHQGLISHNDLLYARIALDQQDFKLTMSKLDQLLSANYLYQELAGGIFYPPKILVKKKILPYL